MKYLHIISLLFFCFLPLSAQNVKEEIAEDLDKAGNIYYVYKGGQGNYTAPPEGYIPFYISHYGRHGSRWLTRDSEYESVMEVFDDAIEAGALTEFGKDLYRRVKIVFDDGIDRGGDLSPLGALQQKEIAGRLYLAYPEVFQGKAAINAVSTFIPRCILSMAAFCERLKELNPSLVISRDTGRRFTRYLNCFDASTHPDLSPDFKHIRSKTAEWRMAYDAMAPDYVSTESIMDKVFLKTDFRNKVDSVELVKGLYFFAVSMQGVGKKVDLYDLFTPEELYRISIYENYRYFVTNGPSDLNLNYPEYYAKLLLSDFISKADIALKEGNVAADFRFGHDTNVMPLLTMLQFSEYDFDGSVTDPAEVAEFWPLYKLSPMAANIQFVFFRKEKDVIVKIMHNETEMHLPLKAVYGPYYKWKDVRKFYVDYMSSLKHPAPILNN